MLEACDGNGECNMVAGSCMRCGKHGGGPSPARGIMPSMAHVQTCPVCSEQRGTTRLCGVCLYDYQTGREFDPESYRLGRTPDSQVASIQGDDRVTVNDMTLVILMETSHGPSPVYSLPLIPGMRLELGRGGRTGFDGGAHLHVADPGISRVHLQLNVELDHVLCTDCGSSNGTLFDGVPLSPGVPARMGVQSSLLIGQSTIIRLKDEGNR